MEFFTPITQFLGFGPANAKDQMRKKIAESLQLDARSRDELLLACNRYHEEMVRSKRSYLSELFWCQYIGCRDLLPGIHQCANADMKIQVYEQIQRYFAIAMLHSHIKTLEHCDNLLLGKASPIIDDSLDPSLVDADTWSEELLYEYIQQLTETSPTAILKTASTSSLCCAIDEQIRKTAESVPTEPPRIILAMLKGEGILPSATAASSASASSPSKGYIRGGPFMNLVSKLCADKTTGKAESRTHAFMEIFQNIGSQCHAFQVQQKDFGTYLGEANQNIREQLHPSVGVMFLLLMLPADETLRPIGVSADVFFDNVALSPPEVLSDDHILRLGALWSLLTLGEVRGPDECKSRYNAAFLATEGAILAWLWDVYHLLSDMRRLWQHLLYEVHRFCTLVCDQRYAFGATLQELFNGMVIGKDAQKEYVYCTGLCDYLQITADVDELWKQLPLTVRGSKEVPSWVSKHSRHPSQSSGASSTVTSGSGSVDIAGVARIAPDGSGGLTVIADTAHVAISMHSAQGSSVSQVHSDVTPVPAFVDGRSVAVHLTPAAGAGSVDSERSRSSSTSGKVPVIDAATTDTIPVLEPYSTDVTMVMNRLSGMFKDMLHRSAWHGLAGSSEISLMAPFPTTTTPDGRPLPAIDFLLNFLLQSEIAYRMMRIFQRGVDVVRKSFREAVSDPKPERFSHEMQRTVGKGFFGCILGKHAKRTAEFDSKWSHLKEHMEWRCMDAAAFHDDAMDIYTSLRDIPHFVVSKALADSWKYCQEAFSLYAYLHATMDAFKWEASARLSAAGKDPNISADDLIAAAASLWSRASHPCPNAMFVVIESYCIDMLCIKRDLQFEYIVTVFWSSMKGIVGVAAKQNNIKLDGESDAMSTGSAGMSTVVDIEGKRLERSNTNNTKEIARRIASDLSEALTVTNTLISADVALKVDDVTHLMDALRTLQAKMQPQLRALQRIQEAESVTALNVATYMDSDSLLGIVTVLKKPPAAPKTDKKTPPVVRYMQALFSLAEQ